MLGSVGPRSSISSLNDPFVLTDVWCAKDSKDSQRSTSNIDMSGMLYHSPPSIVKTKALTLLESFNAD